MTPVPPAPHGPSLNTDREIWRRNAGGLSDYYEPSIHVTEGGAIGMNVGGTVYVMPVEAWHALARITEPPVSGPSGADPDTLRRAQTALINHVGALSGDRPDPITPEWLERLDELTIDLGAARIAQNMREPGPSGADGARLAALLERLDVIRADLTELRAGFPSTARPTPDA